MVKLEFIDNKLYVRCSGSDFNEQIESCRYLKMQYDPARKAWFVSPGKYREVETEFSQYGIEISEYDRLCLKTYLESLSDFKRITKRSERRKFDPSILKMPPKYEWQADDIQRAINQTSMLFKWSTGTGKSYALSGTLEALRSIGEVKKAIVLTSSIGIMNLASELEKFMKSFDRSRCLVVPSVTSLKDRAIFSNDDYDIIILGYDTFKSINDYYDKTVNNRTKKVAYKKSSLPLDKWYGDYAGIVFMDECHLLGNHGSHRADTISMNIKFWKYRYLFSATPADKEEKFYFTLRILDNALVKGMPYTDWLSTYCELGTKFSRYAPNKSTWNYGKWNALMSKLSGAYIAVRDKSLLNLPSAVDVPLISIDMSPQQRAIYESFSNINLELIRSQVDNEGKDTVRALIGAFQTLQMAVDNPEAIKDSVVMKKLETIETPAVETFRSALAKFDYKKHFTKLDALANIIDYECNELGNKILVFYFHPKTLDILRELYPKAYSISAQQTDEERFDTISKFKRSSEKVLFASILIANTSFTLTECKAEVFYERCWSGVVYEQARGRIHRIGQTDEVRYYNICYNNSIDNLQLVNLQTKGQVIESIGKRDILSQSDWQTIFNGSADSMKSLLL